MILPLSLSKPMIETDGYQVRLRRRLPVPRFDLLHRACERPYLRGHIACKGVTCLDNIEILN